MATDPFDIISGYFRTTESMPEADAIAAPDVLMGMLPTFVNGLDGLKLVPMTKNERQGFSGRDPSNQRLVSRGFLRLLRRRPHLAAAAGLSTGTFQVVVEKDEAFDLLANTLRQTGQLLDDGLLLVRASISGRVIQVADHVRGFLANPGTQTELAGVVRVLFGAIDLNARELVQKKAEKRQRKDRRLRGGQAAVATAQQALAEQPAVDRLREAAGKKGGG